MAKTWAGFGAELNDVGSRDLTDDTPPTAHKSSPLALFAGCESRAGGRSWRSMNICAAYCLAHLSGEGYALSEAELLAAGTEFDRTGRLDGSICPTACGTAGDRASGTGCIVARSIGRHTARCNARDTA